jgi:hypothetical protein
MAANNPTSGGRNKFGIRFVTSGPVGLRSVLNQIISEMDRVYPNPSADIYPDMSAQGGGVFYRLKNKPQTTLPADKTPRTFFCSKSTTPADVLVSAGVINNVYYAGGTITAPSDGDKIYIDATISGTTTTAIAVSNAASVPSDTSTHVYTLLASVAVASSVATPTPVAWNYSQMQICNGQAIWGSFGV